MSGFAILTLLDSWDWEDEHAHLLALQSKLNAYFEFIEGGQIWESYPKAIGHQVVIDVVSRFAIPPIAISFLETANDFAVQLNATVRYTYLPDTNGEEKCGRGDRSI